jgi:hypothetical protein
VPKDILGCKIYFYKKELPNGYDVMCYEILHSSDRIDIKKRDFYM